MYGLRLSDSNKETTLLYFTILKLMNRNVPVALLNNNNNNNKDTYIAQIRRCSRCANACQRQTEMFDRNV